MWLLGALHGSQWAPAFCYWGPDCRLVGPVLAVLGPPILAHGIMMKILPIWFIVDRCCALPYG